MNIKYAVLKIFLITFLPQLALSQVIFQTFDMIVSNPAGVVAAMNKYQSSPTGQQGSASVSLRQYIANGESKATHQILVTYPSADDMGSDLARNAASPDWANFLVEMNEVAEVEFEGVGQILAMGGDANSSALTSPNQTQIYYQMSVSDPAVYASAWSDFTAANAENGAVSYLSGVIVGGANPSTHVVSNVFDSPVEAVSNQPQNYNGWDTFMQRVQNIRTVEARAMTQTIATWAAE